MNNVQVLLNVNRKLYYNLLEQIKNKYIYLQL